MVHSADLSTVGEPGLIENQRPLVGISVGEITEETCCGDWSKELCRWCFQEAVTMEIAANQELRVYVACSTSYNFFIGSVSMTSHRVGEVCIPALEIFPRMTPQDRGTNGIWYATPTLTFDLVQDGRRHSATA